VTSKVALKRLDRVAAGVFVLLLAMAWAVVAALWIAGGVAASRV
jgi:hypothetical protein